MSKDIFEIRFHGRGGQGAKTAAALLAEVANDQGKFVQSFPEYGAERQGAPIKAFTRISDNPIRIHSGVINPNIVVVVDPTLLKSIPVAEGLSQEQGVLIANTIESKERVAELTGFNGRIITIDATKIAIEELGRPITNTAMLGAVEKVSNVVDFKGLKKQAFEHFNYKVGKDLAEKNINAINRAYDEVNI